MKDRVPTQVVSGAIRMEQLDEQGNHLGYIYLKRADEPSEEGTPINKSNMLTDETATAIGLDPADDPTPNNAFFKLSRLEALRVGDTITTAQTISDGRFLKCRGQGVSKDDYPDLYNAIPDRFTFSATNVAWNSATITDTSIVYSVGNYYIKLKTSGDTQWQVSSDGASGWSDLPYKGRMYYSSGYYILDSGYICIGEESITATGGWKQITYSSSCVPASEEEEIWEGENVSYVTCDYSYVGCGYEIKSDKVFIIPHYSTEEICYSSSEDLDEDGNAVSGSSGYRTYYVDYIYVLNASDLLTDNLDYKTEGALISSGAYTGERESYWSEDDFGDSETVYYGTYMKTPQIVQSGKYYYLMYTDGAASAAYPYKLHLISPSDWSVSLVLSDANALYTNPGKNVVFVRGSYLSTAKIDSFSSTVYANGIAVILTVPSGKYIFAIGYDRNTNSIVYVVHANNTTGSTSYPWGTYIYNLDSNKTFELDSRASLLTSSDYGTVLGEDGNGNVYTASYRLTYNLDTSYVLPSYEDNGDDKYMKVSL